jgi:lysophospholipase L1-like esterase
MSVQALAANAAQILSRHVPVFASSGNARRASSDDFGSYWRSSGLPATLSYDLSQVNPASRKQLLLIWYNDPTYGYDHKLLNQPAYNNIRSYVLEGNAAAGGRDGPPVEGWVVLANVSGNTLHSREHVFDFSRYNWLRLKVTESDGSPGNNDAAAHVDIYDVSGGVADGWLFVGDSITANGLGHGRLPAFDTQSFSGQVDQLAGVAPPQENAGMPNWTTLDVARVLPEWLAIFPGRYVTLALGTNDAAGGVDPEQFYGHLNALVRTVIAAGKVPVVPTIPWSREPYHAARIPALNAQIQRLYASTPQVLPGPDLYFLFSNHERYISTDGVHPTDDGNAALRRAWAAMAAKLVYSSSAATAEATGR